MKADDVGQAHLTTVRHAGEAGSEFVPQVKINCITSVIEAIN
jgi:hypothetical protein